MALSERHRTRLRGALEAVLRAEEVVAGVADEVARSGHTDADTALDAAAALLRELVEVLEPLTGGR
jgi:hypothetical protein